MKKNLLKILTIFGLMIIAVPFHAMESAELVPKSIQLKDGQLLQLAPAQSKEEQRKALQLVRMFFHFASIQYDHRIALAHLPTEKGPLLVGTALFRHALETPEDIVLTHLVVSDSFQKKGIGRELVTYVTQETCCKTMVLTSATEAIGFYQKLGFQLEKKRCAMKKVFSSSKKRTSDETETPPFKIAE